MPTKTPSRTPTGRGKQPIVISPEEAELIDEALSSVERRLRKLIRTFKHINDRLEASIAAWSAEEAGNGKKAQ